MKATVKQLAVALVAIALTDPSAAVLVTYQEDADGDLSQADPLKAVQEGTFYEIQQI